MIDAFESGVLLTAHDRETDAQAALASMRAALSGVAPEVEQEKIFENTLSHEVPASYPAPSGASGRNAHDSGLPLVLATLRASGRGDEEMRPRPTQSLEMPWDVARGGVAGGGDHGPSEAASGALGAMMSSDGPFRTAAAGIEDLRSDPAAAGIAPSTGELLARKTAGPGPSAVEMAAGPPIPSAFPDDRIATAWPAQRGAEAASASEALRVVLNEAGSAPSAGSGIMTMAAGGMLPAAGPLADHSAPAMSLRSDRSLVAASLAQPTASSGPTADDAGQWDMSPFGAAAPEGGVLRMMVPPTPNAEPGRTDGRSPVPPFGAGAQGQGDGADQRPIVVHATLHLDGSVLAQAVSEHIVSGMNGPLAGTGGFDPRRSYTPVEA